MSELPYNQNYIVLGKDFVDKTDPISIDINIIPKHIVLFYNELNLVPNKVFDKWRIMAPGYMIIFFSFKDAAYFLEKYYNKDYKTYYNKTTYAAHKSDFFRLCFLYTYGGIYSDIDNEPFKNIKEFYNPYNNITFMTALSLNNNSFAQALIISTRNNSCLKCGLDEYINIYSRLEKNHRHNKNYDGADLAGTRIMYRTIVKLLTDNKAIKNNIIRPHTGYIIREKVNNVLFKNNILFIDEFTPNGSWQNSYMRTGFDTVLKCRYDDYPWFNHRRGNGYQTNF